MNSAGADRKGELSRYALRVMIAVGVAVGIIALLALLWLAVDVLVLGFAGILLAVLLRGLANLLARYSPVTGVGSVLVVIVVLASILAAASWLFESMVVQEFGSLARTLPKALETAQEQLLRYQWGKWLVNRFTSMDWTSGRIDVFGKMTGAISTVFGGIVDIVVILFLGLYLSLQPHTYLEGMMRLVPIPARPRAQEVLDETGRTLQWWLIGILCSMTVIGVLSGVGLTLLGVPSALALGLMAGLLSFVPYLGAIVSALPAILIGMTKGPEYALYVAALYLGIHFVEGYLLNPVIHQYAVSLPPALLLFAQIMLGMLLGLMGVALAAPIAATAMVVVRMLYVEDLLGDRQWQSAGRG